MKQTNGFQSLGLSAATLAAIEKKGFVEPSPIQAATIPLLLKNEIDIVGQAQTGTGKTAAFGLPLVELLDENVRHVQALVLVPTRELALQVAQEIISFKGDKRIFIATLYGGQSINIQIKDLKKGVSIVVGTPGRIMDHLDRGTLDISNISHLVLDEADEMLNMGFVEDIESILETTPENKRVLLFSATMPKEILSIAKRYMGEYELIAVKKEQLTTELTEQYYVEVGRHDKFNALMRIIDSEPDFYGLVFCQTKIETDEVTHMLVDNGYPVEALHGDISQNQREKTLALFKKKKLKMVIATDVAARGIDVNNLTHVINYALPQEAETYVHRIGRTGRAGNKGIAISLVTPGDSRKFALIKKVAKAPIEKKKLPGAKEIVHNRINTLKTLVDETIAENGIEKYEDIASYLLDGQDAEAVVASLLKLNYERSFDETNYKEIKEVKGAGAGGKNVRLFMAKGKLDKMTPKQLVDFIERETGVRQRMIDGVKVMEKFSFFTVPFDEAQQILSHFKKHNKGRRSIIEKAKE